MRYYLIPRDIEDAATARRFWLGIVALYALSFAYVVYLGWSA